MTETLDFQQDQAKKVPTFLMVLLVLTSLNILYNIFGSIKSMSSQETLEDVQAELYRSLEQSGTDLSELPAPIQSAFEDFFPRLVNNMVPYSYFELGYYLLLAVAVFLMFRLKKPGLYLYALLQIVGSFSFVIFFGANWITISVTILFLLFALVWILLYWQNRKAMS